MIASSIAERATLGLARGFAMLAVAVALGCGTVAPTAAWRGTAVEPETPAPALAGTNWNGDAFDLASLDGRVRVVFFGYTFCPDICPFALAKLKQVYGALGERADQLAVVFVSVDPQRDSIEKLANYVPGFDQRFYGIRIEPDVLDAVAEGFGVTIRYGRPPDGGDENRYYVDHTGTFFIIDQRDHLRLTFPANATADDLLGDIEALLRAA